MQITVIGAGYVGLVTGACFADFGHRVCCIDTDEGKVEALRRGKIPLFEPGLDELVTNNVKVGRLVFGSDLRAAVAEAEIVFIAVGTPSRRDDGEPELFVHISGVVAEHELTAGTRVSFDVMQDERNGRLLAANVRTMGGD